MVYYEDNAEWTAAQYFQDRIFLSEVFSEYIPRFRYKLVQLREYTKETLLQKDDELALVMLINKLRRAEDFQELDIPEEYMKKLAQVALAEVLDIIARVVASLLRRIEVPEDEVGSFTNQIKERKMGVLFENFEPYSVIETRRISQAEGRKEYLIERVCTKLILGKSLSQIISDLDEEEQNVKPIYDIAITFAPDYPPEKVMEKMGIIPLEKEKP